MSRAETGIRSCQRCGATITRGSTEGIQIFADRRFCSRACANQRAYDHDGAVARFWSKVEKTDGCWLWRGTQGGYGYGLFFLNGDRRLVRAHRLAYELAVGPIPEGMTLDHLCRVRHCCNPAHLEVVTPRENVLRGESPVARAWRARRIVRTLFAHHDSEMGLPSVEGAT